MSAIAWLTALVQLFVGAAGPLPNVVPPAGLTVSAQSCAPCHAKAVAEWQSSAHAHAFDNRLFAASFRYEPQPWCVSCHAPLPEQAAGQLRAEGVSCAACHIRDGAILASRPATAAAARAHRIVVEPQLARADFCAGCHQFNWPASFTPLRYGPHAMQNTVAEFQQTDGARSCIDCHMTEGHRMPGGHDASWLRRALDVSVDSRSSRLTIRLRAHDVGHSVPSGDPFRRLVVQLCGTPTCDAPVKELLFGRRFDSRQNGKLVADTSVPPNGERVKEIAAPEGASYWRLLLRYAAVGTERDLDDDEREQEISNGTIGGGP